MAGNLLSTWPALAVYNRSAPARERMRKAGAQVHSEPATFFGACDAIILMLANDAAADEVLGRGTSDFGQRVDGKLIVNMGTHSLAWSEALERDVRRVGGLFVEAPVSGSRGPAEAGALVAMVAGEPLAVKAALPLIAPMCRQVIPTGAVPTAMACKLAVNLYLIASVAALAEAAALSRKLGLAAHVFERVIDQGPLGSEVSRAKLGKMMSGDFAPEAAIRDVCKNAALVAAAAASAAIEAPMLDEARKRFDSTLGAGNAKLDMAAVCTAYGMEGLGLE
jgi:3-hydroxyisobutyrate dehydrogenase